MEKGFAKNKFGNLAFDTCGVICCMCFPSCLSLFVVYFSSYQFGDFTPSATPHNCALEFVFDYFVRIFFASSKIDFDVEQIS